MDAWSGLAPTFTWRPSQRHLLELAGHVTDRRWHLCAPPGAGKTLIGLELARRLGAPTLVLAPTTAIRDQWRAATAMFGADPAAFTTDDPAVDAPLLAATYQLLGNPGQAASELRAAARRLWVAEVAADVGPDRAEARIEAVERDDPGRARREARRHVRALRRSLGTGTDVGVPREALLGERTAALVEQLARRQVACVVLDECHHLLDWWALVVSALVERLGRDRDVAVVGLTATLPEPGTSREALNYSGLLGAVDAELHLAAMVAEGAVAPWRDGVRLTTLTAPEASFLDDWAETFARELDGLLVEEDFLAWAVGQVGDAALDGRESVGTAGTSGAWEGFWDRDPLAAAALARAWAGRGLALPAGAHPPPGGAADRPLDLDDRLVLVDAWLHDPAAEVDDPVRRRVDEIANRYGVAFTTSGVRWGRSVGDLVGSRSAAKGPAAAAVIGEEAARRGAALRAVVVVERDVAATPPAATRAVLGEDPGTLAAVLGALCADRVVADLGVVAVSGRGAWAAALVAEQVVAELNTWGPGGGGVRIEGCEIAGAVRVVADRGGWTSSRWLGAAGALLDAGVVQVLLATRGLVGEGWDHPGLNVLVDLSEASTRTAATQLRGRAIRIDPRDPAKVASLWDVAVVHPAARGDHDRLRRRHAHWWGPDGAGRVVTGPEKLHPLLAVREPPSPAAIERLNAESAAAVADRDTTLAAWASVDPAGVGTAAVHVRTRRRRRVRTRSSRWRWLAAAATASTGSAAGAVVAAATTAPLLWPVAAVGAAAGAALAREARGRRRGDAETLEAVAGAVLAGLVATGRTHLQPARVRVEAGAPDGWVAVVEGVDDDYATEWADAVAEALGPLGTPRWMVVAGARAWRVPAAVGATRAGAEAFAAEFRRRVPGARAVRAGTPEATERVLAAARERPDELRRTLQWR